MTTFDIDAEYVHMKDAVVTVSQYADGTPALVAESRDEDGYPDRDTLSVNLGGYGMEPPPAGHFIVRDYSEHEGLPDALERAGIATVVDRITFGPFDVAAAVVKLNEGVVSGV